jgi:RNA polymerase sigma-70 factor (ECF subfamily)
MWDQITMENAARTPTSNGNWLVEDESCWTSREPAIPDQVVKSLEIAAFEEMVDRCEDKAYSLALQLVGSQPTAQEILQQAFLLAWQNRQKFAGGTQFDHWVYRIVGKAALGHLKSTGGMEEALAENHPTSASPKSWIRSRAEKESDWAVRPSDQLRSEELCRHIRDTVDRLPTELRTLFILCDSEAMSLEDGAEILDLPILDAKESLHAARLVVRAAIADFFCGGAGDAGMGYRRLSEASLTDP